MLGVLKTKDENLNKLRILKYELFLTVWAKFIDEGQEEAEPGGRSLREQALWFGRSALKSTQGH
eukprot:1143173-Pelagomonas_calceolata.AAC.6